MNKQEKNKQNEKGRQGSGKTEPDVEKVETEPTLQKADAQTEPEAVPAEGAGLPAAEAGGLPAAPAAPVQPPAPAGVSAHELLHPNGGLPARVVIFLLEAFDAKSKGVPTGARSRDVLTNLARYQCSVSPDGSYASVMIHPSTARRQSLNSSHTTHFEAATANRARIAEYEGAVRQHEAGKRRLSEEFLAHVKDLLESEQRQLTHNERQCRRIKSDMERLPAAYTLRFSFDKWAAGEYTLKAWPGAPKKEAKAG